MAMNEIIVIDEDNDDLEEGEITDDIAPDVMLISPEEKPKELPRRYTLHNKVSNGWRKNSKYKEKNKLQNSSKLEAIHRKKHKSSCPRHNSDKHKLKHREIRHSHNTSVFKSAFKNYTSPPRIPPIPRKVNSDLQNSENKVSFQNLLLDYKKAKERFNQKIEKPQNKQDNNFQKTEPINDSRKANISPAKPELPDTLSMENITEMKIGEESDEEDVEELRRIALATRAKKRLISKADEESTTEIPKHNSNNLPNKVSLDHLVETFHGECDNDSHDNYEVVDMDLEEEEDSCQIVNDDNLYIIDKMPAVSEFSPNHINGHLNQSIQNQNSPVENENHLLSNHSQPVDDFEEQLLRAEVIASMNSTRQKRQSPIKLLTPVEEKVSEIIAKVDMLHNAVNTLHNEMKPKPCAIYSKGPLQNSIKQPPKRIIDAKSRFSNFKNNKTTASPPPLRGMNTIQERLIITVNNDDSSTDESEEETNENATSPNVPVSSIEALISSARQKSDAAQLNNGSSVNVSCLSKAQQEEYNSLKKLLAEKTQYSVPAPIVKEKTDQSHINLLLKKISVAKANLEKEVGIKSQIEKELIEKKKNYIASKLRVQMLKEKLHAAEKIRATNLENWKQCSAKLDVVRKSVSKRESLLQLLETELNTKNTIIESNPNTPPA